MMNRQQLKWRNLALLLQGQAVTTLGNQVQDVAVLLWLKELTGSAALMGLCMLLTNLPEAVLAPLGGTIADRFGKVRTMVWSDVVSALAIGMVLLAMLVGVPTHVLILALCMSNLLVGIASSCFSPAVASLIPDLLVKREWQTGNAAHQLCTVVARMAGQGAGGLVFTALGAAGALILNAITFLFSALTGAFIKPPRRQHARPHPTRPVLAETATLLRSILRHHALRGLLLYVAAFHLCLSVLPVCLPFYAEHVLQISTRWFGVFMAAYTVGIMVGFMTAGAVKPRGSRFRILAGASAAVGLLFAITAATSTPWVAWMALVGVGCGIGLIVVHLITELQVRARERDRGGIMGAAQAVGGSSLPVGMALTGILLDALSGLGMAYTTSVRGILATAAFLAILLGITALVGNRGTRTAPQAESPR